MVDDDVGEFVEEHVSLAVGLVLGGDIGKFVGDNVGVAVGLLAGNDVGVNVSEPATDISTSVNQA